MTATLHLTAERAPFVMLPRWLLYHRQVGEGAKFLYCILHDLVAGREGPTRPVTRAELAERCGVSANTIDRRLAELVAVGAVDKEPQILAGGQVGNIYRVWLTPPDQRPGTRLPTAGEARSDRITTAEDPVPHAAAVVDNRLPTGEEARWPRFPADGEPPQGRGTTVPADGEPIVLEEQDQEASPRTPRTAGGQEVSGGPARSRRQAGTNPRALGTHPRAEAELAEAARLEAESAARQTALERTNDARRSADLAARAEADRFEAEALAVSAALSDDQLEAVAALVTARLAGPLARSPLAVARAVVAWCRTASAEHPGPLPGAIAAGVAAGLAAEEGSSPLNLPAAPAGTTPLRHRIGALRTGSAFG